MLFWSILHSLQLSDAETADAGFSRKKWMLSCWRRTPPNYLKIDGNFFGVPPPLRGGNLQRRKGHLRRADSAGEITSRKGRSSPSSSPSSRASSRSSSTSSPTPAPSPSSSKSHLTIATCVVTRTTYPLYSIGVDYYFVVNAIEFCWRNIIMSRLFITYLSPLIMISFMSCE